MIEYILGSTLLIILVAVVLLLVLGFILLYSIGAYLNYRDHKDITKDLCADHKISNKSDRISILNLFFDLGANKKAAQAIVDLEIVDKNWENISPTAGERLKKHIIASGGYDKFISGLRSHYDGLETNEDFKLSISEQIDHDIEKMVAFEPTYEDVRITVQDTKERIAGAGIYAVGEMLGIPATQIAAGSKMAYRIPEIKGITERYYRINVQSKVESPYLQTAEDILTSSGSQRAGAAVGGYIGFSAGDFIGDFVDANGDGIEGLVFGLVLGLGASILTGKFFKKVGKWWKTRKFRNLQDEYHNCCVEFYNQIIGEKNYEILEKNLERGPQYWINKEEDLRDDYDKLNKDITGDYLDVLFEEALELTEKIFSQINRQNEEFINNINLYIDEEEYSKAVQTILAQERIVLRDIHGLEPFKKNVKDKLSAVVSEFKLLEKKGVIET